MLIPSEPNPYFAGGIVTMPAVVETFIVQLRGAYFGHAPAPSFSHDARIYLAFSCPDGHLLRCDENGDFA